MGSKIKRLLVANRGEIAVRILRACRELGIETVQVFSEADRDSLAVRMADRSVCIGGPKPQESYLDARRILAAASALGVDAIHPGYGFLSENADFADLVEAEGFIFVGPTGASIRAMGDKATARKLAEEAGVPTTPGSKGVVASAAEAAAIAERIGYPVLLKASAGGGGRGMRVVNDPSMIERRFSKLARSHHCVRQWRHVSGKILTDIRHIEIQVLGDGHNILHLGERDCSSQRRNQKLVEESPSPVLSASLRAQIGEAAVRLCKHVNYRSAGTIECILDPASQRFYFMEMNTRIQVEHPVTEMVCGIDLVKAQIRIASGSASSCFRLTSGCTVTRSSAASMPKTRNRISSPSPARSSGIPRLAASACVWIAIFSPAMSCRPSMTRSWAK